jgi:ABC-type nickel/cobalt efflux system permease component RcnA
MAATDLTPVLQDLHRMLHDVLIGNLRAFQDAGSATAFGALVAGSFLYGVLHAIGPGHGKVVIGAYMFADERTLRHGLLITSLASLLQAIVAIALVLSLFLVLGLAQATIVSAAAWMECASFSLLTVIGMLMVTRGARVLGAGSGISAKSSRPHACGNGGGCGCIRGHAATMQQLRDLKGLRSSAAVVASIGLRPCTGALFLMVFSCLTQRIWAGIAATLAMGLGTGMGVAAIAVAAAYSRKRLLHIASGSEARLAVATGVASIVGGLAIAASAGLLMIATWHPPS